MFRRKNKNPVPPHPPPLKSRIVYEDIDGRKWVKCLEYYDYLKYKDTDKKSHLMFYFTNWDFEPEQWFIWFKEAPEEGDIISFKKSDMEVTINNIYRVYNCSRAIIN
jgi:hypothetical protein